MSDSNIWIMSASLCSHRYFPLCFSVCCIIFGGKPDTMCRTWVKSTYMWKYAYLFLCQTLSVGFAAVQEGIHLDFGFLIAMITSRQLPGSIPVVIPYVEDGEFFLSVLAPYSAFDFPCDTEPQECLYLHSCISSSSTAGAYYLAFASRCWVAGSRIMFSFVICLTHKLTLIIKIKCIQLNVLIKNKHFQVTLNFFSQTNIASKKPSDNNVQKKMCGEIDQNYRGSNKFGQKNSICVLKMLKSLYIETLRTELP